MSSACVRALGRLAAVLFFLTGMTGCKFDPDGLSPGDGTRADSGAPVDSRAPVDSGAPVDSRPGIDSGAVTVDSGTPIDAPLPPDAPGSNQRRKLITIASSRVAAPTVPGFLVDFPVLFSVVDADIAARASADGRDIYFVHSDGLTRLDHEIEKWVAATGELVAWVKLPQVFATVDTVFYVHYGDPGQAAPVNPMAVWANDFVAVWHLSQNPGPGTSGAITDSTTGNNGTAHTSMQSSDLVAGQIGDAIDFDGSDDEITFQNPISGTTSHTISAWVNQRTTGSQDALVVLGNGNFNQARWLHSVYFGGTVAYGFYTNDFNSGINIQGADWKLLHWTYDGTRNRLYIDGVQQGGPQTLMAGVNTQGSAGRIGNAPTSEFGDNMNLNGQADEVRIATAVRPPEWIVTEYNNQSSPSTFYTVGPEIP